MEKKLPSVFANKDVRNSNNETIYYSTNDVKKDRPSLIGKNVREKINSIFNSNNYIYKADVEIVFDDKTVVKRIIGRNGDYLLTFDNERINIKYIVYKNYAK